MEPSAPGEAAATIRTERLVVRPFTPDDRAAARDLWESALDAPIPPGRIEWLALNPSQLAGLTWPPFGDRAVCRATDGTLVGMVGLVPQPGPFAVLDDPAAPPRPWTLEVGLFWCTHPAHRRCGYATEAARAMIELMHRVAHVGRVMAHTHRHNTASRAVMKALGMREHLVDTPDAPWFQVVGVLDLPALPSP